jgi:plastocyanin
MKTTVAPSLSRRYSFASIAGMLALGIALMVSGNAQAAQDATISIKNHRFEPAELTVPANEKIRLVVKNEDASAEEFESHDFKREKIIRGNSEAVIMVGPLKPGSYKFFGEFHPKTAQGVLVAK